MPEEHAQWATPSQQLRALNECVDPERRSELGVNGEWFVGKAERVEEWARMRERSGTL
jgi:hypothetical protein